MFDQTHPSLQLATDRSVSLVGQRILVVDDHPSIKFTVATALGEVGAKVQFASDLGEAVFRCTTMFSASRPFDLIIVSLEECRGITLCQQLRESGYYGPILGIGGCPQQNIDIDAWLDSPVSAAQLRQSAASLIASSTFGSLDYDGLPPSA